MQVELAPRSCSDSGSQEPLDPALFPAPYDAFSFHGLPTPQQGSSDAGLAQTPMPVGSVDSGLGGEVDDYHINRTRSSSEEKDNLTPAQSRRKAQNRAAYLSHGILLALIILLTTSQTACIP